MHGKWKQKQEWYKKAGDAVPRRCWHWQTISLILSLLTQHHGNGFAGKRRAWLGMVHQVGGISAEEKADVQDEPMLGLCSWPWTSLIGTKGSSWLPFYSLTTLVLSAGAWEIASIWISCHPGNWVVLFLWGVRLRAEGKGAAFHHFTYPLGASVVVVLFGFVWFVLFLVVFLFTRIAPGLFARHFLLWANRVSSSLNHRCLDDRQSPERARHELKKKCCFVICFWPH